MKNNLLVSAGMAFALSFAASGAVAAPYLYNTTQQLEDGDAEVLLSSNGEVREIDQNTFIQVGDLFAGVIKIQQTFSVDPAGPEINLQSGETFTAVFLIDTKAIASNGDTGSIDGSNDTIFFGAATQAQWDTVFGVGGALDISSAFNVSDLDGAGTGLASGTMALMFDGVEYADADFSGATLSSTATSFVSGGMLQYEFGFTGADGLAGANQFWTTNGLDATSPSLAITNNLINRLALDVTKQWAGPDLAAHNWLANIGDLNFTGPNQLQGKGFFEGSGVNSPFDLITDTDLYISPMQVPEPSALALLSLGLLGLGWVTGRKPTNAKSVSFA